METRYVNWFIKRKNNEKNVEKISTFFCYNKINKWRCTMQEENKQSEQGKPVSENPKPENGTQSERISQETSLSKKNATQNIKSKKPILIALLVFALIFTVFCGVFLWDKFAPSPFVSESEESTEEKITLEKPQVVTADDEVRGVYIASVSNINFPSRSGISKEELCNELDAIAIVFHKFVNDIESLISILTLAVNCKENLCRLVGVETNLVVPIISPSLMGDVYLP